MIQIQYKKLFQLSKILNTSFPQSHVAITEISGMITFKSSSAKGHLMFSVHNQAYQPGDKRAPINAVVSAKDIIDTVSDMSLQPDDCVTLRIDDSTKPSIKVSCGGNSYSWKLSEREVITTRKFAEYFNSDTPDITILLPDSQELHKFLDSANNGENILRFMHSEIILNPELDNPRSISGENIERLEQQVPVAKDIMVDKKQLESIQSLVTGDSVESVLLSCNGQILYASPDGIGIIIYALDQ